MRPFDVAIPATHAPGGCGVPAGPPCAFQHRPRWRHWIVLPERDADTPLRTSFLDWLRAEVAADLAAPLTQGREAAAGARA